ncbi:uncharacterized protein LOC105444169 [Strongylocentrotus purpuratus]|uniref:Uncharacterized protein n=1 Tax=Strongylocentrotus purpuratus TaxID=7668 RepID=A0A7M7NFC7_STRPU|nr:uncharacterized protein LOC105444169 [Strongylocentrotus purpuratus]
MSTVGQKNAKGDPEGGVRPEDSASQCGSTTSSVRLRTIARRAALAVEAEALKQKMALEKEELALKQRKAQLDMDTRMKISDAETQVYLNEADRLLSDEASAPQKHPVEVNETLAYPLDSGMPTPTQVEQSTKPTEALLLQILQEGQKQQRQLLESLNVPQTQMMTYDGNPLKYWEFWRAFENSIDCTSIPDSAKLTRLLYYCEGDARKILQPCSIMPSGEGYMRAKAMLQERFGTPFMIADAWIRKVTGGRKITGRDKRALREFADELQVCSLTLDAMGYIGDLSPQLVLVQIVERLPLYLCGRWLSVVRRIRREDRFPNIFDLVDFVQGAADEENDPVYGRLLTKDQGGRGTSQNKKSTGLKKGAFSTTATGNDVTPQLCVICKESHSLFGCDKFKRMQLDDRLKLVRENRLCFNCLEKGHMSRYCKLKRVCSVYGCNRKHTKFLHQQKPEQPQQAQEEAVSPSPEKIESHVTGAGNMKVLLPIVPVWVYAAGSNIGVETLALLDSGSTSTFCTKKLAARVKASGLSSIVSVSTLERANSELQTSVVSLKVAAKSSSRMVNLPKVYTKTDININPDHMLKKEDVDKLQHLTDVDFPSTTKLQVDLLIGQDYPELICPLEIRRGEPRDPYAVRTVLGWTLNGPVQSDGRRMAVTSHYISDEISLEDQCKLFWSLEGIETLHCDAKGMSVKDREVLKLWEDNVVMNGGHYQLPIPFKERPPPLCDNRWMAQQRLHSLRRRLLRDTAMHAKYTQGMADLVAKGYAEEVDETQPPNGTCWYLPHHPVINPKKPDKLRIVFDCAAKCLGVGLNDVVMQGPDLTNKLTGVLLRFRRAPIAIMADVEAMFHQVTVHPDERDVLRFLWWPDGRVDEDPKTYRMCVHLFGGTWSPSCCSFAMRQTAKDYGDQCNTQAPRVVEMNFYVDDCLVSVEEEDEAIRLASELRTLLQKGGFRLAKWMSSNTRVLQTIPVQDRAKQVVGLDLNFDALPIERALGMIWDVERDSFVYKIQVKDKPLTRRGLLSVVSSVYDPLGYASPFALRGKLILQELTRKKLNWDEPIPDSDAKKWKAWIEELPQMEGVEVSRCVKPHDFGRVTDYEIHNFSDASEVAYGAVSYLVMRNEEGEVHSSIIMAKSRLAPVKTVTIPRLELMAATLAVNMDVVIRGELDLPVKKSYFWTDSMIVLHYIKNEHRRFRVFVSNRVAMIHNATEIDQWRHVGTTENPADIVSRGMSPSNLKDEEKWFVGPAFLQQPEERWPTCPIEKDGIREDDPEVKPVVQIFATSEGKKCIDQLFMHYSSWTRLRRAVAWWLRLKETLRRNVKNCTPVKELSRHLTVEDLNYAENAIFQHIQTESFDEEMTTLRERVRDPHGRERPVKKGSRLARLDPVLQDGLLRVGGRLGRAHIPDTAKHQVILPRRHHVSALLVWHIHEKVGHQGQNHVLAELKQYYWILGAGVLVRGLLSKCVTCRRYQAKVGKQKMADLPAFRVVADEPAFTHVGMDYFGPYEIKCGRSVRKRYGVVFTCMTTRAIHIEVANSLDTSSCIDAIRRMMSRRGPIKRLVSDNGTNLVGTKAELRKALSDWNVDEISNFTANHSIDWSFNPPGASHHGGVWERQIRTIRKVLHALLNEQYLRTCQSEEQLHTLMCEVEAIINSRPLTRVSDDPGDLEVITPSSLLHMKQTSAPPPSKSTEGDVFARRRWRQMQYLADLFWKRWIREYLPSLQQRQRWQQPERNLQVGDVVLIADGTVPRCCWLMGRVLEVYPG